MSFNVSTTIFEFIVESSMPAIVTDVSRPPGKSHVLSHIPNRHRRTNPMPPDKELSVHRTKPTPPDQSDRLLPPHNPSVVGSIPTGPTNAREIFSVTAVRVGEVFEDPWIGVVPVSRARRISSYAPDHIQSHCEEVQRHLASWLLLTRSTCLRMGVPSLEHHAVPSSGRHACVVAESRRRL